MCGGCVRWGRGGAGSAGVRRRSREGANRLARGRPAGGNKGAFQRRGTGQRLNPAADGAPVLRPLSCLGSLPIGSGGFHLSCQGWDGDWPGTRRQLRANFSRTRRKGGGVGAVEPGAVGFLVAASGPGAPPPGQSQAPSPGVERWCVVRSCQSACSKFPWHERPPPFA